MNKLYYIVNYRYGYQEGDYGVLVVETLKEAIDFIEGNLPAAKGDLSKFNLMRGHYIPLKVKEVFVDEE